ncbi:MAG: hypothetical protein Q7R58_00560 [bacterium]|nr:hypothetical protein [bacterium]
MSTVKDTASLRSIAGMILNEEQEFELYEFLRDGLIKQAKEYLLSRVESVLARGGITQSVAAKFTEMINAC